MYFETTGLKYIDSNDLISGHIISQGIVIGREDYNDNYWLIIYSSLCYEGDVSKSKNWFLTPKSQKTGIYTIFHAKKGYYLQLMGTHPRIYLSTNHVEYLKSSKCK